MERLTAEEVASLALGLEAFLRVLHDAASGAAAAPHFHPEGVVGHLHKAMASEEEHART
jgi:hypothetical protein